MLTTVNCAERRAHMVTTVPTATIKIHTLPSRIEKQRAGVRVRPTVNINDTGYVRTIMCVHVIEVAALVDIVPRPS